MKLWFADTNFGIAHDGKTMTSEKLLPFRTALKTILSDVLGVAGALFILVAIIGFKEGALYSPIIGSGIGTWLLIRIWDRSRKKDAE
jgi:hypothetical protein